MVEAAAAAYENNSFAAIDEYIQEKKDQQLMLIRQGDPRFGPTHHPLIPQTKLAKQGHGRILDTEQNEMKDEIEPTQPIKKDVNKSTKDKFFSFEKVPSKFLENMPPLQLELHKRRMEYRRRQLVDLLSKANMTKQKRDKMLRLQWVIIGAIDHKISMTRLYEIYQTYPRLSLVPEGYSYAPLYMHDSQPHHMERLQERIENHKLEKQLQEELKILDENIND